MLLRPSAAHRWWRCSASISATRLPDALPEEDQDAAREGTCAAWVAECVINGDASSAADMLGRSHENGWEVDDDMVRHVQEYIDVVVRYEEPQAECHSEMVLQGDLRLGGTADAKGWSGTTRRITDLKYGYGIVEAQGNKQLICYAVLDWYGMTDAERDRCESYCLAIYQPRALHKHGPYRKWVISKAELNGYAQDLFAVIDEIGSGTQRPGKWCNHCAGAAKCEALTQSVYAMWQPIEGRVFLDPTGQQLADELDMLERLASLLKARRAAVEAEAEVRITAQKIVPGWVVGDKIGKSHWKHDNPEVIRMMAGVDPYEKKLITPAEAKRRGANAKIIEQITYRPTVGHKLTRLDDNDIKKAFGG